VPGARAQGPFPALALPDLEGNARSLAEAWAEGDALILIGHRDCARPCRTSTASTAGARRGARPASCCRTRWRRRGAS